MFNTSGQFQSRKSGPKRPEPTGRGSNYALCGAKSRAGAVKRRNHFITTEPSRMLPLQGEGPDGNKYAVMIGKRTIGVYSILAQAESIAASKCGYVMQVK